MANGRRRSHGGKSTGPRTATGRERLRAVHTAHGWHGAEGRALRAEIMKERLRLVHELRQRDHVRHMVA